MAFPSQEVALSDCQLNWDFLSQRLFWGNGSPESIVKARVGSLFLRLDGGTSTTLYVKETNSGATTGWVAK